MGYFTPCFGEINARDWGIIGDGVTDNGKALYALRDHLRSLSKRTIVFPPGEYLTTKPYWLKGIPKVKILGYGATFRSCAEGKNCWNIDNTPCVGNLNVFRNLCGDSFTHDHKGCRSFGSTISSESAGASSVTVTDESSPGTGRALIYGLKRDDG